MKTIIGTVVGVAIGIAIIVTLFGSIIWNLNHCVSDIAFDDVVSWKEINGRYFAELGSGALEKVTYATYYERDVRAFVYNVRICDGKTISSSVNNWLTYSQ